MAANPPSNAKPSGDNRSAAGDTPIPLTFEDKLNQFWQKNRGIVFGLVVLVLAIILGKGLWESHQRDQERDIESAYANASTPEQLRAFVSAHPDHALSGIAEIRLADDAYTAGKSADAIAGYDKAISTLKTGPLVARAQLGRALAKIQAGKAADATADLKQLAGDANQLKAVRAEAAYQLASLAADSGNVADVQKYVDQLNQIDPASAWARRAVALRASLPAPAAPSPLSAPAASAPAATPSNSGPSVQVTLPKK